MLVIMLPACSKPLAVLEDKDAPLIVDVRDDFDPKSILKGLKDETDVSYVLDEENSKLIITLTNGKRSETIEKEVTVQYPLATFKNEDMTIDLYKGYDINELVDLLENTTAEGTLDEANNTLTVTATNGDRTESITSVVTIIDTTPTPYGRTYASYHGYFNRDGFVNARESVANDIYGPNELITFIDDKYAYFDNRPGYFGAYGMYNEDGTKIPSGTYEITQNIFEYYMDYVNEDLSYFEGPAHDLYNGYSGSLSSKVSVTWFVEVTD